MKAIILHAVFIILFFTSCKKESESHEIELNKALQQKELVYNAINKAWNFPQRTLTAESEVISNSWNEWRLFISELNQKPKGTIGAFQRKTKSLTQKTEALNNSIPGIINKPQIKSRIMALTTKVKSLHTFLNLDKIPEKKIISLVSDLNLEVNAIQDQIEEIVRRSHIQKEEGEQEMLNSLKGINAEPSAISIFN